MSVATRNFDLISHYERKRTTMLETRSKQRGHKLIPAEAASWPALYSGEDVKAGDKLIQAKFFALQATWYLAEYDPEQNLAFGYADLGNAGQAEWGYFSMEELEQLVIARIFLCERDLSFTPKPAREVLPERAWSFADKE